MSLSLDMLQSDLDFMINDLPATINWKGDDYVVSASDPLTSEDLELAGIMATYAIQFVISLDDFEAYPAIGDSLTFNSASLVVLQISDSQDGLSKTLTCGRSTQ